MIVISRLCVPVVDAICDREIVRYLTESAARLATHWPESGILHPHKWDIVGAAKIVGDCDDSIVG